MFGRAKKQGRSDRRAGSGVLPVSKDSIYSYTSKRSERTNPTGRQIDPDKPKKTRRKRRAVQHIPALILVIAVISSLVYLSTVDPKAKIVFSKSDDKNTTNLRDASVYQASAEDYINGSIVNRSKFLFDSQGLVTELKHQYPEIAAATVTVPIMGRRPVIKIQTTRPGFVLISGNRSLLVGTNGIALADTKDVRDLGDLNLRTVADESGIDIEPGKSALPQEQAQFIAVVVEQFEKQNLPVQSLTIPTSPYDLHVKLKDSPYFIKFNILEEPKQQVGSFIALKRKLDTDKVVPKEYVDVRVGERVYYK